MKTVVVVAAGAADRPLEELGGRTPLEAAATPVLDRLARKGRIGRLVPAPSVRRAEEGAFALAMFGLDAISYGDVGAALEAAAFGVEVGRHDQVLRLALVSADDDTIYDATAGGILRDEAALLLESLGEAFSGEDMSFHAGHGARHLCVWKGSRELKVELVPPFDAASAKIKRSLPRGTGAKSLIGMIERSREVFAGHEVNSLRIELGENPATLAWPWGPGVSVPLPDFTARTGLDALVVGVDPCFLGAARMQGVETVTPEGSTGRPGSNLRAKADAALAALESHELVYVHVDAAAAASHARDFVAKVETLERFDGYVLGRLLRALEGGPEARLVVVCGPGVATETGAALRQPVPFALWGAGIRPHGKGRCTEVGARDAGFQIDHAHEFLEFLLHR